MALSIELMAMYCSLRLEDRGVAAGLLSIEVLASRASGAIQGFVGRVAMLEEQQRRLGNMLTATGGAAGFNAQQMNRMADDIVRGTTYTRQSVLEAITVLTRFQEIRGPEFEGSIRARRPTRSTVGRRRGYGQSAGPCAGTA